MKKNLTSKPLPSYAGIHYMTPQGHAVLEKELYYLLHDERPKIVKIVAIKPFRVKLIWEFGVKTTVVVPVLGIVFFLGASKGFHVSPLFR